MARRDHFDTGRFDRSLISQDTFTPWKSPGLGQRNTQPENWDPATSTGVGTNNSDWTVPVMPSKGPRGF